MFTTTKLSFFLLCWCGYFVLQEGHAKFPGVTSNEQEQENSDVPLARSPTGQDSGSAKSDEQRYIECQVCQQRFTSGGKAQGHVIKTGHAEFAEVFGEPPKKTEQEKLTERAGRTKHIGTETKSLEQHEAEKQRMDEIQQMAAEREEKKKQEVAIREHLKRKAEREYDAIKNKMRQEDAVKMIEKRKRKRMEDHRGMQRVRDAIANDWAERDSKYVGKKATRSKAASRPAAGAGNKPSTSRLRIQSKDGSKVVETFQATDTFQQVLEKTGMVGERLITPFPRREYSSEDSHKTLEELGLTPSGVLVQM